jgi:hypothetical protein
VHAGRDPAALAAADPLAWLGGDARSIGLASIFRASPVALLEVARPPTADRRPEPAVDDGRGRAKATGR